MSVKLGKKQIDVNSKWLLVSRKPKDRFIMSNISSFIPEGQGPEAKRLFKTQAGDVTELFIDRHETTLDGALSLNDKHNIEVLLSHPDVALPFLSNAEWENLKRQGIKKGNPSWELKNIDAEQIEEYQDNLSLLKLRFWLMNDEDPISLKKIIFFCSYLGLPYSDESMRYSSNEEKLRATLLTKIDHWITNDPSKAKALEEMRLQDDKLEMVYYIREMKKKSLITYRGSLFYIGDIPVGSDEGSILSYFESNKQMYEKIKEDLISRLQENETTIQAIVSSKEKLTKEESIEQELEDTPI